MTRRTKIVATIGPASDDPATLSALIDAGMDVARLGLAHNTIDEVLERYRRVRAAADAAGRPVGILIDLPGPKVRLGSFGDTPVEFAGGHRFTLVPGLDHSDSDKVGVDYEDLLSDVHEGDYLAVGDGSVVVRIESIKGDSAEASVAHGGPIQGRPGLHIPSDRLSITSPTQQDLEQLDAFVDAREFGAAKPDPEPYLRAAEALGTAPERIVFLDDAQVCVDGANITWSKGDARRLLLVERLRDAGIPARAFYDPVPPWRALHGCGDPLEMLTDWQELGTWRQGRLWLEAALTATHPTTAAAA